MKSNSFQSDYRTFVETVTDISHQDAPRWGHRAEHLKKTCALYNDIFKFIFWDPSFLLVHACPPVRD